jgi:hypothetical protein
MFSRLLSVSFIFIPLAQTFAAGPIILADGTGRTANWIENNPNNTLAAGKVPVFGSANFSQISSVNELDWQASGILKDGCDEKITGINQCFESFLSEDPEDMLEEGSPAGLRQRNEFLTPGTTL